MDAAPKDKRIEIYDYDPTWPERFEDEKRQLQKLLAPWLFGTIEHIGSTAVPGLAAKPVIDMMAPVLSLEKSQELIEIATHLGYLYYPYKSEEMHWFCKPSPTFRTHHLHVVPCNSQIWVDRLAFRDELRKSPELVNAYRELKLTLATEYKTDRDGYTAAKGPFIQSVVSKVAHRK